MYWDHNTESKNSLEKKTQLDINVWRLGMVHSFKPNGNVFCSEKQIIVETYTEELEW